MKRINLRKHLRRLGYSFCGGTHEAFGYIWRTICPKEDTLQRESVERENIREMWALKRKLLDTIEDQLAEKFLDPLQVFCFIVAYLSTENIKTLKWARNGVKLLGLPINIRSKFIRTKSYYTWKWGEMHTFFKPPFFSK